MNNTLMKSQHLKWVTLDEWNYSSIY